MSRISPSHRWPISRPSSSHGPSSYIRDPSNRHPPTPHLYQHQLSALSIPTLACTICDLRYGIPSTVLRAMSQATGFRKSAACIQLQQDGVGSCTTQKVGYVVQELGGLPDATLPLDVVANQRGGSRSVFLFLSSERQT
ncbi:hypothetical protein PM082_001877 [Marasmius tenuissimus]|nr:hypothetical protein PM082_001877 [Marasmius tenuissimus]